MMTSRIARIVMDHAPNVNCLIFWRPIVYLSRANVCDDCLYYSRCEVNTPVEKGLAGPSDYLLICETPEQQHAQDDAIEGYIDEREDRSRSVKSLAPNERRREGLRS
jgi:hypothetical protein